MDELAKTEARNYLSAAGFFLIAAWFILCIFTISLGSTTIIQPSNTIHIALGIGLLIVATLLIVLHKRDMIAILFFMMGFYQLFFTFTTFGIWNTILLGFILLVALITLTGQDKKKWMLFLIPLIFFIFRIIALLIGYNSYLSLIFFIALSFISIYYAFCCACERCSLPGSKLLTAEESTDFKASGSVLGYVLFATTAGVFALFYAIGNTEVLSLEAVSTLKLLSCILMMYVSVLLLAVGKMRFTPVMFLLLGLTLILSVYSTGYMIIGVGILLICIGLFAILRKESRILPGLMLIIVGCSAFISAIAGGLLPSIPWLSVIFNGLPALIAIYLAFVVYSQRKLPKF